MGYSTITFGGTTIPVTDLEQNLKPGTLKQKNGAYLAQSTAIGRNQKDWELVVQFRNADTEANNDAFRAALVALDDVDKHQFVDGIHDGEYIIIPGSLRFKDTPERKLVVEGTMTLIQFNQ